MNINQAIEKFNMLPEALKAEAADFIEFLFTKAKKRVKEKEPISGYGLWKGKIEMSPDFDEPLEDFNEYI